ncbi:MAG TPA: hypothetical protein VK348_09925, partial [Planctomycetota bacterium]|nr:hypothetical protein [Planctomycetota bacterium]
MTVLAVSIAAGAFNPVRAQYWQTWRWLHSIENIVEDYHREHGHYPSSLADVPQAEAYRQGPIEYRREGESYVLVSFGTDNKPGGLGDAADV